MLLLAGVGVIACGFALRLNPLLVVAAAALATGLAAGLSPIAILAAFGHAFNANRYVSVVYIVLPVIGLLEAHGLQARARGLIERLRGATVGRLLVGYMVFRQLTAAIGLTSIAGQAQTIRPLIAPMAEAAAETHEGEAVDHEATRALAAATENIALFFGEDIFLAVGSILLMKGVLEGFGIAVAPFALSVWAMPSAAAALAIHGGRLLWRDRRRRAR